MRTSTIKKEPFPSTGLDNYFFTTPALRLRLDLIREYIRCSETPVLVLGESGVGKSALLNQLVCRADANWRIVRMPAVHSFSATEVITFLNAELRMPTRIPVEDMLKKFDDWLDRLDMRGQIAVIVIDNAHDFCDESLVRLATLREDVRSQNLCVLMTGEPGLRSRISALLGSSHSQVPMQAINIPSLDQREVASYIDMRLYHAGLEGRGPFSRATIDEIARSSRGYPGRINVLANRLLYGERRKVHWQGASQRIRRIMRHWLTLAVVVTTVALSSIMAPGSVRITGEGSATAYSPALPMVGRNRRSEVETAKKTFLTMASRAFTKLRGMLPRLWGIRH